MIKGGEVFVLVLALFALLNLLIVGSQINMCNNNSYKPTYLFMVSKCGSAHVLNLYLEDIDCIHLKAMCDCCKYVTVPKIIFGTVIYCITVDLVFVPHQKKNVI